MMKTSENQQNSAAASQDAQAPSAQASNDVPPAQSTSTTGEVLKKPHLKLFNCLMKPSLSLTSLPPQSPKETADETQLVERPYNSLKVRAFVCQVYENWLSWIYFHIFRRNATVRRNFGGVPGSRRIPSARLPLTPAPAADVMETTSGRPTTSSWTPISSIRVVRRRARRTRHRTMSRAISELCGIAASKW